MIQAQKICNMYPIFDKHRFEYPATPSCDVRALLGMKLLSFKTISKGCQFSSIILFNSMKKTSKIILDFEIIIFKPIFNYSKHPQQKIIYVEVVFLPYTKFSNTISHFVLQRSSVFAIVKSHFFSKNANIVYMNIMQNLPIWQK